MIGFASGGVCTGTLIAPDVVLTAGHCVQGVEEEISGFYLGAGGPVLSNGGPSTDMPGNLTRYEVDKVALYPGFDVANSMSCPLATTDVAVLHLATPVTPVTTVRPQSFPRPGSDVRVVSSSLSVGQSCWTVGYGRHDVGGVTTTKEKRVAQVRVQSLASGSLSVVAAAGPSGGITDEGDSGGPLLCAFAGLGGSAPWRVVGVVSCAKDGVAAAHHEQTFVRTDGIADWLAQVVVSFPLEERCTTTGAEIPMRCDGQALQMCDGQRWRTLQTCSATQTCSAQQVSCHGP
ncbi:MAG: trypsin-like serine protease [Myxococcales bacterium]|nr:trypsin-like serine protease [Myxococcales bacterium]